MPESRNIALFGGTFDPVHLGHIQIANAARTAFSLDEIRFIPCQISPHKRELQPTPTAQRLEMLEIATASFPWAVVDDFETLREGPSYSYQTAEAMRTRFPEARLFWIMGSDQWEVMDTWTQPERIAACVEFIVFTRGSNPKPRDGYVLHVMQEAHPASASTIRHEISKGAPTHPWLNPSVDKFVRQHRLYRAEND
ncbi:MAG: nicotinate (nicotinamide) nucleotide adenylyltransferase [Gloeobacteraceae cyanobacterium ES-bin-144]|nr:nicotinate (nicotinamide) nucleotide adenylyltransferase [Verrucomicrobiales bacterium]